MSRILCRYSRKECKENTRIYPESDKEDLEYDQMTLKDYVDPFTGEPVIWGDKK